MQVLVLDKTAASLTLLCFNSALLSMSDPPLNRKYLVAVLTRPRFQLAPFFMRSKLHFTRLERTVLTLYFYMGFQLVVILVRFCHHQSTLCTFVVDFSALHLVHSILACFNVALAVFALLCFFGGFNH